MNQCKTCGSHAINQHQHGRAAGVDLDLCDVCYWRARAAAQSPAEGDGLRAAAKRALETFDAYLDRDDVPTCLEAIRGLEGLRAALAAAPAEPAPSTGWTGNADADLALILLDRLDDTGDGNAVRIEQLEGLVRKLAASNVQPKHTAPAAMVEAVRNAVALADKSDKLDRDRLLGRAVAPFVADLLAAPCAAPVDGLVIKLGSYGQAFDLAGDRRAYTYKHQPGNQAAWRIGDASSRVEAGGDLIDRGLSLLKVLEAGGFGVFELDEAAAVEAPVSASRSES